MTSNMAEMFNNLLRGCRGLPVTTIASFTFHKLNAWFVARKKHARCLWIGNKPWPQFLKISLTQRRSQKDKREHVLFL
jgi:hypothetical protein